MVDIIVFGGPSLPSVPDKNWEPLLQGVQVRPPAQRGDILAVMDENPKILVLVDGYASDNCDYGIFALTHQEVLDVLSTGVCIIGAASMGALYAAELIQYGMQGVGQVFEWLRDGVVEGKDELIVLHLPQEFGYEPITVAVVEVRYALQQLTHKGYVSLADSEVLVQAIKELPFTERSLDVILKLARDRLSEEISEALHHTLRSNSVKKSDARLALEFASSLNLT